MSDTSTSTGSNATSGVEKAAEKVTDKVTEATKAVTAPSTSLATRDQGALVSEQGKTSIADTVVSKIAGIATREVNGVHALGGGASRAVGALRERIPGSKTNLSQGVSVEVGERQAAVDVEIVAEYGVAITDLAAGIRRNVIDSIESMTGLEVTEVNVAVLDVFVDDGTIDPTAPEAPRVE